MLSEGEAECLCLCFGDTDGGVCPRGQAECLRAVGAHHPPRHPPPPASVETSVKIRPAMPTELSLFAARPTEVNPVPSWASH